MASVPMFIFYAGMDLSCLMLIPVMLSFSGKLMGSSCAKPDQKGNERTISTGGGHHQTGNAYQGGNAPPNQSNVNQTKAGGLAQNQPPRSTAPGSES